MIATILFWLGVGTLVLVVAMAIEFAVGNRSFRRLRDIPPLTSETTPRVSIIVAGRNEERKIEAALESLLNQDYPNIEYIVVEDRSTDGTGVIVDRVAQRHPPMRVVHVTELPKGWLGKNHALHCGGEKATGEILLFTDADVHLAPSTISRAVHFMERERIDHLALAPRILMPGLLLNMFAGAFALFFGMYAKPWKVRDPKSKRHVGIGAFNMVRAAAWRGVGGHKPIAMRPDDDVKLGKILKRAGHRQELILGYDFVSVEWYASFRELVRGLEKNTFAGVDYRPSLVLAASLAQFLVFVWPVIALLVTGGATFWLNATIVVALAVLYADNAGFHGLKRWHWVGFPLTAILFQYIVWNATIKTWLRDGINWRDTHYSLAELRANKV